MDSSCARRVAREAGWKIRMLLSSVMMRVFVGLVG